MSRIGLKAFPKAAQKRIADLEAEVEEWRKRVMLLDFNGGSTGLPADSRVGFAVGVGDDGETIEVMHDGKALRIAYQGTRGRLVIYPDVSNVITLKVVSR